MAPLSIMAGLNGSGKSSLIQAILLFRQMCEPHRTYRRRVSFIGEYLDLGGGEALLHSSADRDIFSIGLSWIGVEKIEFEFERDDPSSAFIWKNQEEYVQHIDDYVTELRPALLNGMGFYDPTPGRFNYLNAERYGPRKALPTLSARGAAFDVGKHGEYVLDALLQHQDSIRIPPPDPRALASAQGDRLRDQLEAWLSEISPGARLSISGLPEADLAVGTFSFGVEGALRSPEYRSTNVGFGLSYILPVIAAVLAAPSGALLLLENPEAHLHPRGQTRLGELCARASAAGVQIIMETHSDHVIDGIRLSVREGVLPAEKVALHYLSNVTGRTVRKSPTLTPDGKLTEWPDGFFDQHRRNAARLARRG